MGKYGNLDLSIGDPNQALKKIEKVTEQFSSYTNSSYGTTTTSTQELNTFLELQTCVGAENKLLL